MESYAPLLEKTRVPQPSLQKFAVISIFSKLRSAPKYLDQDSEPGREAVSQCLNSYSAAVVDQSVRELCRLVSDSQIDISRGLLELQSALEGTDPKFVAVFVKGLGFLVRYGFRKHNACWRFHSMEPHPFVKALSCRVEVQAELQQQVLLFILHNKQLGMVEVCEFLRPLLYFSILRFLVSESSSSSFTAQMVSSMASFCCSFPSESLPIFKLLTGCVEYLPYKTFEDHRNLVIFVEHMVEAYTVALTHLAGMGSLISEAQLSVVEFLETTFSLSICLHWHTGGCEPMFELSKRLLSVQKDLGLRWLPEFSPLLVLIFTILVQSELEHEQISMLKLILLILKWKYDYDDTIIRTESASIEETLFLVPAISLMSSPSKSVKGLATDLVLLLEKILVKVCAAPKDKSTIKEGFHHLSTLGTIISRLLRHLWYQVPESSSSIFLLNLASNGINDDQVMRDKPISWVSHVKGFCLSILDRWKSPLPLSHSQEVFMTEMPLLLSAVIGVLLMHSSMGTAAVDSLAAIGKIDPKLGVPLLLTIMFYSNLFTRKDVTSHDMVLKTFEMLPPLASHSAMTPLVVQTILPMLDKDAKLVLYATAIRLLCRTWEVNDRAFGSLQKALLPKAFADFMSERAICISMAASIRDVCHKNPDRGVDLILSVSSCIENPDSVIKALGLQSLAHLCEADVIDFYTAWGVIAKYVQNCHADPILTQSICLLLRWGAMDAEAYPEASQSVVQYLWGVGIQNAYEVQWERARISAFEALAQYQVSHLEKSIPDFKKRNLELFFSETNPNVLMVMEDFQVKIITYEHINRRRLVKEKRVAGSKIEKLMNVFPRAIFPSGRISEARELPGAALLCLSFSPKDLDEQQTSKKLRDVHAGYENAMVELATSLQLSRNILVALMALQSWKSFTRCWMRAYIQFYDAKAESNVQDRTSKAASDILKSMIAIADEAIPRSAENIALAIGALSVVLPPTVHTVKAAASKFLLEWLLQHEHEHRQWSAAISLGLISSCLHVTDHKQRYHNITGLLEVLFVSKSSLVKGACGVGLGFSCQDLLTRVEAADNFVMEKEIERVPEPEMLGRIIRALSNMICQIAPSSSDILESLCSCFPTGIYDVNTKLTEPPSENFKDLEEDIWGVAGLILGLANSVSAIYRAGEIEAVLKLKSLVISWLPYVNSPVQRTSFQAEESEMVLSVGSCIAVPTIVAFCLRMDLIGDSELDQIVGCLKEFISDLISVRKSGILHQSLLMASCIGAGTVLSYILNEGVHAIEAECVEGLMDVFKKCYSNPYPSLVHLGSMFGVASAMGGGAEILVHVHIPNYTAQPNYQKKETSLMGPLLRSSDFESNLTSLVQEMFLVAQNSDDRQLQQYASWVLSFLRQHLLSKDLRDDQVDRNAAEAALKSVSQSFAEDNVVFKLSLWLMDFNYKETGSTVHVGRVVTVLRCLSRAPRLPSMDWGAVIRRCMRYEAQAGELSGNFASGKGTLREECIQFALAHANQFDSLLSFLDELSNFSRFRQLELNLQSRLLIHLADLMKVYSGSRIEKLFSDVSNYISSFTSYQDCDTHQKSLLCISCWKGLYQCLDEVSVDTLDHISHIEKCTEVLFSLLPVLQSSHKEELRQVNSVEEWSEAVRCLGKTPQNWLLDFLKVSQEDLVKSAGNSIDFQKKICAKAKLVKAGSLPLIELGKVKSYILNSKPEGLWDMLVEVVATLHHADGIVKRQWLVDAIEISCVSRFPSTALKFIGLLSATSCKYMPILIVDQQIILNDLPVTLTSLLVDRGWDIVAETVVSHLYSSTERIYYWATQIADGTFALDTINIDQSENHMAAFLLLMMHHTCVLLKDYLPLEKQLKLATMVVD